MTEPDESSAARKLEEALAARDSQMYELRLFVAGVTPLSLRAVTNVKRICETYLAGRYELRIIDIYQNETAAREGSVVAAPTLVRDWPLPVRLLVGDMSDTNAVLQGLNVIPDPGGRKPHE